MSLRPEQVRIIVDSREQSPFNLAPLSMESGTLPTGDYCLAAARGHCIVERKSASDLLGCIGRDRIRFEKELERLRSFPSRLVLVETDWNSLLHDNRSKLSPTSIAGTIAAWSSRFTPIMFAGTRELAQDFCRRFLLNEARKIWAVSEAFRREVTE